MSEKINVENVEELVKNVSAKAEDYLKNPEGLEALLVKMEEYLKTVPYVGESASRLPLMVSMIRSYITKEYQEVSPKVIASLVGLVIYLLKEKDLIPDRIPLIGKLDDIAAIVLVLKFNEAELQAYSAWRENKASGRTAEPEVIDVTPEETPVEEPAEEAEEVPAEEE